MNIRCNDALYIVCHHLFFSLPYGPSPDKGPLKAPKNGRRSAYKIKSLPCPERLPRVKRGSTQILPPHQDPQSRPQY